MIFIIVFALIIGSQALFSHSFFSSEIMAVQILGAFQLLFFAASVFIMMRYFRKRNTKDYRFAFYAMGAMIASGVPALAYLLPGIGFVITKIEWLNTLGWSLSAWLFLSILFGIFYGRWNWKIHKVNLAFAHLPENQHEVKIVQISDVHVGSFFNNHKKVEKAIEKINSLNPDYVVFTGDLVNNAADEMHGWEPVFSKIKAKKGKFSILGNHDYGDYVKWETETEKQQNLNELISIHKKIGFTPLLNEAVELGEGFWMLGVENWGKAPFRQSGELHKTLENVPSDAFKLLLSHDPSHFDLQVLETDVDLTLSGHTHGMQFGIERFGIKLSPVSLRYKKWAGLYQVGKQYLYVNRGFGYLGFPGRVGIYPEITEITLRKK
jgi:hypothetical protein